MFLAIQYSRTDFLWQNFTLIIIKNQRLCVRPISLFYFWTSKILMHLTDFIESGRIPQFSYPEIEFVFIVAFPSLTNLCHHSNFHSFRSLKFVIEKIEISFMTRLIVLFRPISS